MTNYINMGAHMGDMASVNISITKDVYDFLVQTKKDKSFSQAIIELKNAAGYGKGSPKEIMKSFGALKNSNWNEIENEMKSFREEFEK